MIVFSMVLLFNLFILPCQSFAQPKIQFQEESFDLGQMYQNDKKNHIFEFKNTGTETLTVEKVKGG